MTDVSEQQEGGVCVCYQEERSVALLCRALDICERLPSETAAGDVKGLRQSYVILRVHKQTQIGAENSPNCCFHLQNNQWNEMINASCPNQQTQPTAFVYFWALTEMIIKYMNENKISNLKKKKTKNTTDNLC